MRQGDVLVSIAIQGCLLEQAMSDLGAGRPQEAVGMAEQLGDLYCKLGCYSKALDAYHLQVRTGSNALLAATWLHWRPTATNALLAAKHLR